MLASFRDDSGRYGASGVTHSLTLMLTSSVGRVAITDNNLNSAYGHPRYNFLTFGSCNRGCDTDDESLMNTTILANSGARTPIGAILAASGGWGAQGSVRLKVTRTGIAGEHFKIQMTDTMGTAASATKASGATNSYNSNYEINLNLLDKTTWSGNEISIPTWVDNTVLCKYLGSRRIGIIHNSQALTNWYHLQFSGTPTDNKIVAPLCTDVGGPTTTISITATTGTTTNITTNNPCNAIFDCEPGVPRVNPKVKVTMQNMPLPTLDVTGVAKVNTKLYDTLADTPILQVYNTKNIGGKQMQFTFGGDNTDLVFGNAYPKFRIYPYNFQQGELSQTPVYEAIFDTLPKRINKSTQAFVVSGQTFIPFSTITLNDNWEYIMRPSYLFKDKSSVNDYWIDTDNYPTSSIVSNNDLYMILVSDPPLPNLGLESFLYPEQPYILQVENTLVDGLPDVTATTYNSAIYKLLLDNKLYGTPLVTINGVVMTAGMSASTTSSGGLWGTTGTNKNSGDYRFNYGTNTIEFYRKTVQNGDVLQIVYDGGGGLYTQFFQVPETVTSNIANEMYEKNGYYFINLTRQALGALSMTLNGATLISDKDYKRVGETQVQLMIDTNDIREGDTIGLWYMTIYSVISTLVEKEPKLPVTYIKGLRIEEDVIVKLYNNNGDIVSEQLQKVGINELGGIDKRFILKTPAPGTYSYEVIINRFYPLINGETVTTSVNTDRITFKISRDTFYSPTTATKYMYRNTGPGVGGGTVGGVNIGGY